MILYNKCRMDSPRSIKDMDAMLALVKGQELTAAQFVYMLGISPSRVDMYTVYLCGIKRLEVARKGSSASNAARRATYRIGPLGDEAPPVGPEGDSVTVPCQNLVGANDWPRGEHAHRSGLLAYFYPMAQG